MGIVRRACPHGVRRRALSVPTCVRTGKSVGFQERHPCPRSHQRQHRSGTRSSAAQLSDSSTRPSSHTCLPDLFQRQPPAQAARLGQLITLVHAGGIDRHLVGWPRAAAGVEPVRCTRRPKAIVGLAAEHRCPMAAAQEASALNRITSSRRRRLNHGRMLLCHWVFECRRVGPCGSCLEQVTAVKLAAVETNSVET